MNSENVKLTLTFKMKDGTTRKIIFKPFRKLLNARTDKEVIVITDEIKLLTGKHLSHDDGTVTILTVNKGPVTIDENNCAGWCYKNRNAEEDRLI